MWEVGRKACHASIVLNRFFSVAFLDLLILERFPGTRAKANRVFSLLFHCPRFFCRMSCSVDRLAVFVLFLIIRALVPSHLQVTAKRKLLSSFVANSALLRVLSHNGEGVLKSRACTHASSRCLWAERESAGRGPFQFPRNMRRPLCTAYRCVCKTGCRGWQGRVRAHARAAAAAPGVSANRHSYS